MLASLALARFRPEDPRSGPAVLDLMLPFFCAIELIQCLGTLER